MPIEPIPWFPLPGSEMLRHLMEMRDDLDRQFRQMFFGQYPEPTPEELGRRERRAVMEAKVDRAIADGRLYSRHFT